MARPKIPAHFQPLASAYMFLSPSRAIGFGAVGCIPLTEIATYHAMFPLGYAPSDFVELIRLIDLEYVQLINRPSKNGNHQSTRGHD
jgi:hypothetical protein